MAPWRLAPVPGPWARKKARRRSWTTSSKINARNCWAKCPRWQADGYNLGDKLKGACCNAKYSRYMQRNRWSRTKSWLHSWPRKGGPALPTHPPCALPHHQPCHWPTTPVTGPKNKKGGPPPPPQASHTITPATEIIREGRKTKEKVTCSPLPSCLAYRHLS